LLRSRSKKEIAMPDRDLLDEEIIDLTDLLEEGTPSGKPPEEAARKRPVTEPDSFDLGKELATDLDIPIEEIDQDTAGILAEDGRATKAGPDMGIPLEETPATLQMRPEREPALSTETELALKEAAEELGLAGEEELGLKPVSDVETLLGEPPAQGRAHGEPKPALSTEIDLALKEAAEELGLAGEEELGLKPVSDVETLLGEPPAQGRAHGEPKPSLSTEIDLALRETLEEVPLTEKEQEVLLSETPEEGAEVTPAKALGGLAEPTPPSDREAVPGPGEAEAGPVPPALAGADRREPCLAEGGVPVGDVMGAVVEDFRKDMPALLESIVRPLVQELVQEIVASTREVLPGLVEKVIREEIEKLKKLAL